MCDYPAEGPLVQPLLILSNAQPQNPPSLGFFLQTESCESRKLMKPATNK